jgi:hypothetical protein
VHDVGVVLAGEDIAGAAHVGRELVDLLEIPVHQALAEAAIPEIADYEVVGLGRREFRKFEIGAAHEEPLALQPAHQVAADEPARPAHQCRFHRPAPHPIRGAPLYHEGASFDALALLACSG